MQVQDKWHIKVIVNSPKENRAPSASPVFPATHWSAVLAARNGEDTRAQAALEELCRAYWRPIYAYLRRVGNTPHDAQDWTQGFFAHFLQQGLLQRLHHREGRFRSFIFKFLKRYLSDERDKANAAKRGGHFQFLSWEDCSLEEKQISSLNRLSAGVSFDRRWAMTLLNRARVRLETEYASAGKDRIFEKLQSFLSGEVKGVSYADLARDLAMPENSVKSAIHRLRRHYGDLIREEVAHTVEAPLLIDEEIRYLLSVVTD